MTNQLTFLFIGILFVGLLGVIWWICSRRKQWNKSLHHYPSPQIHTVNGVHIYYTQMGRGPHLVLFHGLSASIYSWRFLMPMLSRHYTVTALDIPGFGSSSKDPHRKYDLDEQTQIITDFLNEIKVKQAILIGSSMGGTIALWLSKMAPKRFSKVIALAPATNPSIVRYNYYKLAKTPLPKIQHFLLSPFIIKVAMKRAMANHHLITSESINAYLRPYISDKNSMTCFFKSTKLVKDPRLPHKLKDISSRVHILYGEKDKVIPRFVMEELVSIIPNVTLKTHSEAGHHIMEDIPHWTYDQIMNFLTKS